MAEFEYVNWTSNTPLSADRFSKMSENDQHLKDLNTNGPRGVLGFAFYGASRNAAGLTTRNWVDYNSALTLNFTVGENRLIRGTFHQTGARSAQDGVREVHTKLLLDEERNWGYRYQILHGKLRSATPDVVRVGTLTAGEHTIRPQFAIWQGRGGYFTMYGWPNDPMFVLVEDLGPRDGENIA